VWVCEGDGGARGGESRVAGMNGVGQRHCSVVLYGGADIILLIG